MGRTLARVLVVDDEQADREGIRDFIDWGGLGLALVGMAADGREGLRMALELRPDVVVADIAMPLMDGLALSERLRDELPGTRIILMSCHDSFEFARTAVGLGVAAYVLKPVRLEELEAALRRVRQDLARESAENRRRKRLSRELASHRPLVQERLMTELLCGAIDEDEARHRLKEAGIAVADGQFTVAWVQIDAWARIARERPLEERYRLQRSVRELLEERLRASGGVHATTWEPGSLILVLFPRAARRRSALEDLRRLLADCVREIEARLATRVSIGIGGFARRLDAMHRLAAAAEYAVRSRCCGDDDRVLLAADAGSAPARVEYSLREVRHELETALEDAAGANSLDAFIHRHYGPALHGSPSSVRSFTFALLGIIEALLAERNLPLERAITGPVGPWDQLAALETVDEVRTWVGGMLVKVRGHLARRDESRYRQIVSDLRALLDSRYREIESTEQAVAPLSISVSFANALFRRYLQVTVFEYLTTRRIEAAKELLRNPYCRIGEVAEQVGYRSVSHFTSLFRERTGVTPKRFANRYAAGGGATV